MAQPQLCRTSFAEQNLTLNVDSALFAKKQHIENEAIPCPYLDNIPSSIITLASVCTIILKVASTLDAGIIQKVGANAFMGTLSSKTRVLCKLKRGNLYTHL